MQQSVKGGSQQAIIPGQRVELSSWRFPLTVEGVGTLVQCLDVGIIFLISLSFGIAYHLASFGEIGDLLHYTAIASAYSALFVALGRERGLYDFSDISSTRKRIYNLVICWVTVFIFLTTLAFMFRIGSIFSRGIVLLLVVGGGAVVAGNHAFWSNTLRNEYLRGRFRGLRTALFRIGRPRDQERPAGLGGLDVVREFDLKGDYGKGELHDALASLRGSNVQEIVVVVGEDLSDAGRTFFGEFRMLPLPVRVVPSGFAAEVLSRPKRAVGARASVEWQRAPLTSTEQSLKRALDAVVALGALVVLSPLMCAVALAIVLESDGPVFFRQSRRGFNGRDFVILKFRSMSVAENGDVVVQAKRGDARVTRVGRWIRRTSIDELPQLLNVLAGDMSIVGPRPHAVAHDKQYDKVIANYAFRHHMKPGITGWAQANGYRGETITVDDMARRIEHDLWYVDHWSLWLDIRIIVRTALKVLNTKNVY